MADNTLLWLSALGLLLTPFIALGIRSRKRNKKQEMFLNAINYEKIPRNKQYQGKGFDYDNEGNCFFLIQNKKNPRDKIFVIPPKSELTKKEFQEEYPVLL